MKNLSVILLAFMAILSGCTKKADNSYKISGSGWEKYNGKEFRIGVRDTSATGIRDIGNALIEKGNFVINGSIEHPQTAFLAIYTTDGEFCGWKQDFIVESGNISLELKNGVRKSNIIGGKYNGILFRDIAEIANIKSAKSQLDEYSNAYYALKKEEQNQAAQDKFMKLYNTHANLVKNAYSDLLKNNKDPYVRLLCLSHLNGFKNLKKELVNLEQELGNIPEIEVYKYSMKKAEEAAKNRKTVGVGNVVKDFTAKNLNGESFNLSDVLKENKYVLVEFWASWCSPCRAEIPHMKKAYANFKDKDFEIVSFTLDHLEKSWKKASDKEQIPWINVGDLKAYKSPVVQMYGVQGVPANFLVNKTGEIIAVSLRGEQLDKKLDELLN